MTKETTQKQLYNGKSLGVQEKHTHQHTHIPSHLPYRNAFRRHVSPNNDPRVPPPEGGRVPQPDLATSANPEAQVHGGSRKGSRGLPAGRHSVFLQYLARR